MKLVTAIVRPEKVMDVIKALEESGYFAFSKWAISGRGKEKGIQVGDVLYQEMAKSMLYITVEDKEKDEVVDIIVNSAKSGAYGHYGDGKIFVSDIEEAYTISEETREDEDRAGIEWRNPYGGKENKIKKVYGTRIYLGSSGRINYWMGMLYSGGTLDTESRRTATFVSGIFSRRPAYDRCRLQLFLYDCKIPSGRW